MLFLAVVIFIAVYAANSWYAACEWKQNFMHVVYEPAFNFPKLCGNFVVKLIELLDSWIDFCGSGLVVTSCLNRKIFILGFSNFFQKFSSFPKLLKLFHNSQTIPIDNHQENFHSLPPRGLRCSTCDCRLSFRPPAVNLMTYNWFNMMIRSIPVHIGKFNSNAEHAAGHSTLQTSFNISRFCNFVEHETIA